MGSDNGNFFRNYLVVISILVIMAMFFYIFYSGFTLANLFVVVILGIILYFVIGFVLPFWDLLKKRLV